MCADLEKELGRRALIEILCRDLARRALVEIVYVQGPGAESSGLAESFFLDGSYFEILRKIFRGDLLRTGFTEPTQGS